MWHFSSPILELGTGRVTYKSSFVFLMVFPGGSGGIESTCNVGDLGLIPGLGRSPGEGKGYQVQYSGLENFMDSMAHGVAKSWTRLKNFDFAFLMVVLNVLIHWAEHTCFKRLCLQFSSWILKLVDIPLESRLSFYI